MNGKAKSGIAGGVVAGGATAAFLGTSGSIGVAGALPLLAATGIGLPVAAVIGVALVGGALATAGAHSLVEDVIGNGNQSNGANSTPGYNEPPPSPNGNPMTEIYRQWKQGEITKEEYIQWVRRTYPRESEETIQKWVKELG